MKIDRFWQVALVAGCMALLGDAAAERQRVAEYDPLHGQRSMISQRVVSSGDWVTLRERFTPQPGGFECAQPRSLWLAKGEEAVQSLTPVVDACWQDGAEQVLHVEFVVPDDAPAGVYRILWYTQEGQTLALGSGVALYLQGWSRLGLRGFGPLGNLLQDSGFEAGAESAAWMKFSEVWGTPICSITDGCSLFEGERLEERFGGGAYLGDFWAWLGGGDTYDSGFVCQSLVIPNVEQAVLDFYLWMPGVSSGAGKFAVVLGGECPSHGEPQGEELFALTEQDRLLFSEYRRVVLGVGDFADGETHALTFWGEGEGSALAATAFFLDEVALVAHDLTEGCVTTQEEIAGAIYARGAVQVRSQEGIVSSGDTLLLSGSELQLVAPKVTLQEGFRALPGSHLVARAESVTCAE